MMKPKQEMKIRRVACYIRVSSLEQANFGHSLQMQQDELAKWAKANNCIIHDYYIDDGFSATSLKRPALQRMIAESKDFDMIIFVKLDRFSRGVGNYYKIMERLEKTNTHWKAIFEEFDTTTTQGRTVINLYLTIAQQEAEIASERTKAVFKNRLERGECILSKPPRGYKRVVIDGIGKMVIDEEKAPFIKAAFEHYIKYGSQRGTLVYLNEELGDSLTKETLKSILKNKVYTGTYVHKDHGEYPNFCEPIITEEQYYKAQEIRAVNQKKYTHARTNNKYIFSGMLFCEECGHRLGGCNVRDSRRPHLPQRLVYRCGNYVNNNACVNKYPLTEKKIEQYLVDNVRTLLEDKIITYKVEKKKAAESPTAKKKQQIQNIRNKMTRLKELYMKELIQLEEYEIDYNTFKDQLNKLQEEISHDEHTERLFDISTYEKFLEQDFETIYLTLEPEEKRRLWLSVISNITAGRKAIVPNFF